MTFVGLCLAAPLQAQEPIAPKPGFDKINHIIVLYLENRSFDSLYGLFPGAEGIAQAANAPLQVDKSGKVYDKLPPVMDTNKKPAVVDTRFPADLQNKPFRAEAYAALDQYTGDLVHRWYQEQVQIDGGRMDKFAAISDAGGLVMSYYDGSHLPLWQYAKDYVLADHFFHAAFGGSFLNHFWLVCACTPRYDNAPAGLVAQLDDKGQLVKDGAVTPDGYAVNTIQSVFMPHSPKITDKTLLLPAQDMPTIGDRLSDKSVSWAWYAGGWDDAVAGHGDKLFQYHHGPFAYFTKYGDGTAGRAQHLKDEKVMMADIAAGTLPAVTFFKPIGEQNEHPGYADVLEGDTHAAEIIKAIQASPLWKDSVIIVTYDENGGLWDHVAPPATDKWGPGTRVPTIIISPFAKRGFIDHTVYDTTSILKLIETRYGLVPLGTRDAGAADLSNALALQ
ncbi:MAG TPA: alkaline phosphatase family protein [Verrucomicrobiae bacterium]|nr:alkaline phosphatase family protein [Verrucomicrobiae bacterium]